MVLVQLVLLDLTVVLLHDLVVELLVEQLTVNFLAEICVNRGILIAAELTLEHLESHCPVQRHGDGHVGTVILGHPGLSLVERNAHVVVYQFVHLFLVTLAHFRNLVGDAFFYKGLVYLIVTCLIERKRILS